MKRSANQSRRLIQTLIAGLVLTGAGAFTEQEARGQGAILSAAGANSRSIAGATTAAPISAMSALHWNPASISGLGRSEVEVGFDVLKSNQRVSSSYGPFQGETRGDSGPFPIPNFGWVHATQHPALTVGLGVNSVAGFKTNLPADPTNLVLAPAPVGLGAISSEASFIQITPVVSYAVTDRLSIGAGPSLTLGQLSVSPFVFGAANGDGTYSSGHSSEYELGGGFQLGAYYQADCGLDFGFSLKSPAWMKEFTYDSTDENGMPKRMTADVDLPMILSFGTALRSIERWLFSIDFRYIDYANTNGLGSPSQFRPDGSLVGLNWRSIFATSMGAERAIGDRWVVGVGYAYNQSPIEDVGSFANIASPLHYEHMISMGTSYAVSRSTKLSAAYSHYFENELTGPMISPIVGPIAGSSVNNSIYANVMSFGITMAH